jgi:enamine deaminase RidA (YjgF/YER057c/UK114 family)
MTDDRRRHFTGSPFETQVAFARSIRIGSRIVVAGTLGTDPQGRPAGDAYGQTHAALGRIASAIEALGGSLSDVVRTRMFALDVADFEEIGRAHAEVFAPNPPVTSFLVISGLVVPGCVVEVEAEAEVA